MRRSKWLLLVPVLLLIIGGVCEITLLVLIGELIGFWPTLGLIILSAIIGILLARHEGRKAWSSLLEAVSTGRLPAGHLADGALILLGGVLFILPGFIGDVFGLLLLAPWTRPILRSGLAALAGWFTQPLRPEVIEGEVVADSDQKSSDDPPTIEGEILP